MDETHVAALCRALGAGVTRRGAMGVLAGVLGLGLSSAAARDGAVNGLLGGRRGKNRRGRNHRNHRRRKQQRLRKNERGRSSGGPWLPSLGLPSASDWARCEQFRDCRSIIYDADGKLRRNLQGADLHDCNLCGVTMKTTWLVDANFRGANLLSADLSGAILWGTLWDGADLHMANLYGAKVDNMERAHFCRTIVSAPGFYSPGFPNYAIDDRDCNVPIGVPD